MCFFLFLKKANLIRAPIFLNSAKISFGVSVFFGPKTRIISKDKKNKIFFCKPIIFLPENKLKRNNTTTKSALRHRILHPRSQMKLRIYYVCINTEHTKCFLFFCGARVKLHFHINYARKITVSLSFHYQREKR